MKVKIYICIYKFIKKITRKRDDETLKFLLFIQNKKENTINNYI